MGAKNKYSSAFFNSEKYYDPTVGMALLNIIREEKKKNYVQTQKYKPSESIDVFAIRFCRYYEEIHPARANGKPLKYAVPSRVRKQIKLYEYCMSHCNDSDFAIDDVMNRFGIGTPKYIRQIFSGSGDIGKLTNSWNTYKATGRVTWNRRAGEAE